MNIFKFTKKIQENLFFSNGQKKSEKDGPIKFPPNFTWGTATAAFQIEGHPDEYREKLSDWAEWIDKADKVKSPNGAGLAVKHYEKLEEDLTLINDLGADAYRFSFNWAALHRGPDDFHEETLAFYERLLDGLKVKPFATLVHFVLPNWLAKEGGWENPNTACEFNNFVKFLLENFGEKIQHWITFNEPNIFLGFGYESGIWPPGKTNDLNGYFKAYQGMLTAHELAYKSIKEYNPRHQVGFSQNMYYFQSYQESQEGEAGDTNRPKIKSETKTNKSHISPYKRRVDLDQVPAVIRDQLHNYSFIESCLDMGSLDFLGVNYYTRFIYKFSTQAKDPANPDLDSLLWGQLQSTLKEYKNEENSATRVREQSHNSLGWEIYPEGLYKVLSSEKFKKLLGNKPIFITENGYSHIETSPEDKDLEDEYRVAFIKGHLEAIHSAIQENVNIQGYFYWSLIDNFEWALGMEPRFGLIHVDHETYNRTPKASYHYYSEICKTNQVI
jgi:beta-glucosidase